MIGTLTNYLNGHSELTPSVELEFKTDVLEHLRKQASRVLSRERKGHILQTDALVNEVWLQIRRNTDDKQLQVHNRAHFIAIAVLVMKRVLVQESRGGNALKRGGGIAPVRLEPDHFDRIISGGLDSIESRLNFDQWLDQLGEQDKDLAQLLYLALLWDYSVAELAQIFDVSEVTIRARKARALAKLRIIVLGA